MIIKICLFSICIDLNFWYIFFLYFLDFDFCQLRIFFQYLLIVGGCWYLNIYLNIKKVLLCKKIGMWLDLKLSCLYCRGLYKYYFYWFLSIYNIMYYQLKKIYVFIYVLVYFLVYILFNQVCLLNLLLENIGFFEYFVLLYVNLVLLEYVFRVVEEYVSFVQEQDYVLWIFVGYVIVVVILKFIGVGIVWKNYFG